MKKLPVRNTEALRLFLRLKGVGVFTIDLAFILLPEIWHRAPGTGQPNPVQYSANISWQRRLWKLPPLPAPALRGQGRWNSGYEGWKHWLWSLQCTCGSSPLCFKFWHENWEVSWRQTGMTERSIFFRCFIFAYLLKVFWESPSGASTKRFGEHLALAIAEKQIAISNQQNSN